MYSGNSRTCCETPCVQCSSTYIDALITVPCMKTISIFQSECVLKYMVLFDQISA